VSGFDSIIDQEQPLRILFSLLRSQNIPHALLFTGIEGVGKKTAAKAFAMACNCIAQKPDPVNERLDVSASRISSDPRGSTRYRYATNPCGRCKSCKKIESGNHPDIILIEPSGAFIKIDQIRELCHALSLKPYEARLRVAIICDAHTMNPSAGNALLKVLEEPPDQTMLILIAPHSSDLLPTVASRCQLVRFNPISRKKLIEMLVETQELDPDGAAIIASMANGSFSKALSMVTHGSRDGWINWRYWFISEIDSLSSRSIALRLEFASRLAKNKDLLPDLLEVVNSYFRDIVVWKYCPEKIINKDLTDRIQYASQKMSVASLLSKIKDIRAARRDIRSNANTRLTLEVLMMKLSA
jgi:DNA polymerase-3 subunit delta'